MRRNACVTAHYLAIYFKGVVSSVVYEYSSVKQKRGCREAIRGVDRRDMELAFPLFAAAFTNASSLPQGVLASRAAVDTHCPTSLRKPAGVYAPESQVPRQGLVLRGS